MAGLFLLPFSGWRLFGWPSGSYRELKQSAPALLICLLFSSCHKPKPFVIFHIFGGEESGNVLVFISIS